MLFSGDATSNELHFQAALCMDPPFGVFFSSFLSNMCTDPRTLVRAHFVERGHTSNAPFLVLVIHNLVGYGQNG